MNAERWARIAELFEATVERDEQERRAYLDSACAGDHALRREVESILRSHEACESESFIESAAYIAGAGLLADGRAAAEPGESIGRYRILSLLGAGGMGEVYLAEDERLGRRVALKVLPERLSCDVTELARLEREARAASALNHPNILTVHEVGEETGRLFIAAEFVDGITLRQRLAQGPMDTDESIDVAIQIASALVASHAAGVVHRDIKPENVMIRRDGYVKVLDFGIAKLADHPAMPESAESTERRFKTSAEVAAGTAHYMSPEHAKGCAVDARTDVWSLGVVLYEMIARCAPFDGESPAEVLVAVLHEELPPLATVAAGAPVALQSILQKALHKDPDGRYQTTKNLLDDLRTVRHELDVGKLGQVAVPVVASAPKRSPGARHAASLALVLATVSGGVFALYGVAAKRDAAPPHFSALEISRVTTNGRTVEAAVSPDGRSVVYAAGDVTWQKQTLWLRQLGTNIDTPLAASAAAAYSNLTFSRDGNHIFYTALLAGQPSALYRMPAAGGKPTRLWPGFAYRFALSPDAKQLAYVLRPGGVSTIFVANVDGTGQRGFAARALPDWLTFRGLDWSPDGRTIVCGAGTTARGLRMTPIAVDVSDGSVRQLGTRWWPYVNKVAWLADGSGLLMSVEDYGYQRFPQLWHISYPAGDARRITHDLNKYSDYHMSVAADGSAAVTTKSDVISNIWIAPGGDTTKARQITFGSVGKYDGLDTLSWTPEGRLVYGSFVDNYQTFSVMDADGSASRQLTDGKHLDSHVSVDPQGRYFVFKSDRAGRTNVWRINADGTGARPLTDGPNDLHPSIAELGASVIFSSNREGEYRLYKVPIGGGAAARLGEEIADYPEVSPDGRLVAFVYSDPRLEPRGRLGVRAVAGGPLLKSFESSHWGPVRWTPDGRAITYPSTRAGATNLWTQPLNGGPPMQVTSFTADRIFNFAWSRDGRQLALARGPETADAVLIKDLQRNR